MQESRKTEESTGQVINNKNPLNWMMKCCQSTTLKMTIPETMEPISKVKRIEKSLTSKINGY